MPYADPSIILGAQQLELPDRQNMLLKALQAQGLQGQNQLQSLQLQQGQQSFDATNRLNAALQADPTLARDPNRLMSTGGSYALPMVKNFLDTQKTQGEITGTNLGNADKARTAVGSLAGSLATTKPDLQPTDIARFAQEAAKVGVTVDPQDFAGAMKPDGTFDAEAARHVLLGYQSKGMTPDQQMTSGRPGVIESPTGPVSYNKANPNAGFTIMQPQGGAPVTPQPTPQGGQGPQATPVGFPTVSPQMQMQRDGERLAILRDELSKTTDPGDRAAIQSEITRTSATQAAGMPFGGQQVAQAPTQPQSPVNPFMKYEKVTDPLTGRVSMVSTTPGPDGNFVSKPLNGDSSGKLSKEDQAIADQIAKYDISPPSGMALRNPRMANIMAAVADQHPDFDATQYAAKTAALKAFSTGSQGNSLRSFAVATDHLDTLQQLVGALKNGDYPLINKLANTVSTQTGGTAPTNFDTAKDIVSKEVIKAIVGGGGGVSEREDLAKRMNNASTPAQLLQQIDYYKTLMGAQRDALVSQYENTTGRTDAATRFNFGKKSGGAKTPPPISQSDIDALNALYPTK